MELKQEEVWDLSLSPTSENRNTAARDLHPLEGLFKRHISEQKWPCSRCNQDFAQYRDLYLHMEADEHVIVEPPAELKPLYEKMKKGGSKGSWYRFMNPKQQQKRSNSDLNDDDDRTSPPPSPSNSPSKKKKELSDTAAAAAAHFSIAPILTSKNLVASFVIVSVDCYFCEEMLDSIEELNAHLLEKHGHKKALCFVEGCYASFDEWDDHNKHIAERHVEADFCCSKCRTQIKFKNYNALKGHLYKEHHTGIFRCPLAPDHCSFDDQMLRAPVSRHFQRTHKK